MKLKTTLHPMDFDSLEKGSSISPEELEKITGTKYGTIEYSLGVLSFTQRVEKELEARGLCAVIVIRKEHVVVLTDEDASFYTSKRFGQAVRTMYKQYRKKTQIDRTQLTGETCKQHDRDVINQSRILQALTGEQKQIALEERRVKKLKEG